MPRAVAAATSEPRVVFVTGAGSGIGLAITRALSAAGHGVVATARRPADLALLAAMPGVRALQLDVRSSDDVAAARAVVESAFGRLDGLVHNAGIGEIGHLAAWSDGDMQRIFDINVFGPQRLTRELLPLLLAARGRVVCIGSQGGSITRPLMGPYTMTKHALEAFAACLGMELAPHGVQVSIVQPGAVATRIGESALPADEARLRATPAPFAEEAAQLLRARQAPTLPRGDEPESVHNRRAAAPERVAEVVLHALFDARPQARYLVGTRWEGDRVLMTLTERLLDAAQSPSHAMGRDELIAWIDAVRAHRAARP